MINVKIPSRAAQISTWTLWLLLSCCALLLPPSARADDNKLLIIGDSLSAAYGIAIDKGWVSLLEERLNGTRFSIDVVNASVSGDTTANGRTKLPGLVDEYSPAVVLIELGGNDGLRGLSIKKMNQNLTEMTQIAKNAGAEVIITGIQIPSNYGAAYTRMFTNTFANVAESNNAHLIPFLFSGLESGLEWFQSDGVHPNEAAQPVLLDNVWAVLEPILEEKY